MLEISWDTILKLSFAGIVFYVVAPLLFVIRDHVLWFIIEKFFLTKDLRHEIRNCALYKHLLQSKYNNSVTISNNEGEMSYKIVDKEVLEEEYTKYYKAQENLIIKSELSCSLITKKHNRLNSLLKYFKQEISSNPIPRWLEEELKYHQKTENK